MYKKESIPNLLEGKIKFYWASITGLLKEKVGINNDVGKCACYWLPGTKRKTIKI